MTTVQAPRDTVEQGIAAVHEQVLPAARQMDGFKGMVAMGDRTSGKMIAITFWESEQALTASEEAANKLRAESASAGGEEILSVERFEVLIDERES